MSNPNFLPMIVRDKDKGQTGSRGGFFLLERRKDPRISLELPFDYSLVEEKEAYRGMIADASEGGLLIHLLEKIDTGAFLRIEILFSKATEMMTIKAIAKIVWSDLAAEESWAEYQYGLQFLSFFEGDVAKLKMILKEAGKTLAKTAGGGP